MCDRPDNLIIKKNGSSGGKFDNEIHHALDMRSIFSPEGWISFFFYFQST